MPIQRHLPYIGVKFWQQNKALHRQGLNWVEMMNTELGTMLDYQNRSSWEIDGQRIYSNVVFKRGKPSAALNYQLGITQDEVAVVPTLTTDNTFEMWGKETTDVEWKIIKQNACVPPQAMIKRKAVLVRDETYTIERAANIDAYGASVTDGGKIKDNQSFAFSFLLIPPPNKGAMKDVPVADQLFQFTFGGKWSIRIIPDHSAELYQQVILDDVNGDSKIVWSLVSKCPYTFAYNETYTMVIEIVFDTILIRNGFNDSEREWSYTAPADPKDTTFAWLEATQALKDVGHMWKVPILTEAFTLKCEAKNLILAISTQLLRYYPTGNMVSRPLNHTYEYDPEKLGWSLNDWLPGNPALESRLDTPVPVLDEETGEPVLNADGTQKTKPNANFLLRARWFMPTPDVRVDDCTISGDLLSLVKDPKQTTWQYTLTFNCSADALGNPTYEYTPYVFKVSASVPPTYVDVTHPDTYGWALDPPNLQALDGRVLGGSVKATARELTGSITLDNFDGRFTGLSGFVNCSVDIGWWMIDTDTGEVLLPGYSEPPKYDMLGHEVIGRRIFTGYAYDPTFTRDAAGHSVVTLSLRDPGLILDEMLAIMLPAYDGQCVYYAYYDILRRAGFVEYPSSDETIGEVNALAFTNGFPAMLAYQNTSDATDYITLREYLKNDATQMKDWLTCWSGECDHIMLSSPGMDKDNPSYMYADGTALSQCLKSLNDFFNFWIYFNNWGNWVIRNPADKNFNDPSETYPLGEANTPVGLFSDVINVDQLSQIGSVQMTNMNLKMTTSARCNTVIMSGNDVWGFTTGSKPFTKTLAKNGGGIERVSNGILEDYRPWHKTAYIRSTQFDPAVAQLQVDKISRKYRRPRMTLSMDTNGNPGVFPLDRVWVLEHPAATGFAAPIINIIYDGAPYRPPDEYIASLVAYYGVDPEQPLPYTFIVDTITHDFNQVDKFKYTCKYELDWVIPDQFAWMYDAWH